MSDGRTRQASAAGFRPAWLDALNFLLADVQGAVGPYLNVFLVTTQHWNQASVGIVTTTAGLLGLAVQTPAGAAIDATRRKRGLLVASLAVLGVAATVIYAARGFWPVLAANALIGTVGAVFGPVVGALTLGLYAQRALAPRFGRNAAFNHAGNVAVALLAGGIGYLFSQAAVFLLVPACAVLAAAATLAIPARAIDHARARGAGDPARAAPAAANHGVETPSGLRALLGSRPLLVFALCGMVWQFANAPLLPLVGQKLAAAYPGEATAMMSACIVAAQLIMLPIALAVGHTADRFGRKPILLIAFAILPVRAALFTVSNDPWWLVGVQLLDGVGAGIFGAITPLVISDLTRGTGRFNVAQGGVGTVQGIGAATSGLAAGLIVDRFGYDAAFLEAAAVALLAALALLLLMPETADQPPSQTAS